MIAWGGGRTEVRRGVGHCGLRLPVIEAEVGLRGDQLLLTLEVPVQWGLGVRTRKDRR